MGNGSDDAARLAANLARFLAGGGSVVLRELGGVDRRVRRQRDVLPTNRGTERAIAAAVSANRVVNDDFAHTPFVACIGFTSNGSPQRVLICRGTAPDHAPKTDGCEYVSYFAPRGQLAAMPLGRQRTLSVPAGPQRVAVFERHKFQCVKHGSWDATNNLVEGLDIDGERFQSLRALFDALPVEEVESDQEKELAASPPPAMEASRPETRRSGSDLDPFAISKALAELNARSAAEAAAANERRARAARLSREILDSVGLRDQATLDEIQDEVFRLPINSVLALTGAPGTGKTTTLIKRIAQKSQRVFLSDQEIEAIGDRAFDRLFAKGRAWVLFTPNDLLRTYVKDAIGKEGLKTPAGSLRTWRDQQRVLARDVFALFGDSRSRFIATRDELVRLDAHASQWDYVDRFESFWNDRFMERSAAAFERIASATSNLRTPASQDEAYPSLELREAVAVLVEKIGAVGRESEDLRRRTGGRPVGVALGAASLREAVREAAEATKSLLDVACKDIAVRHPEHFGVRVDDELRKRRLGSLRRALTKAPAQGGDASDDDTETEDAGDALPPEVAVSVATGGVAELLAQVRPWSDAVRAARWLSRGIDALFAFVSDSYRIFRRRIRNDSTLVERFGLAPLPLPATTAAVAADGTDPQVAAQSTGPELSPLSDTETDVVLFALLRISKRLMDSRDGLRWSGRESRVVNNLHRELRGLVTVDEAPDFSAVQLGCMYHLSHPAVGAFSMSGDLMQRTTNHGLRSWQECEAFADGLEVREFRRVYRQSKRLTQVAAELYRHAMREDAPFDSPYPDASDPPPLVGLASSDDGEARWLASRIREIVRVCGRLPSIGVFVPSESDVEPMKAGLEDLLYGDAIDVEACKNGQVLGSDVKVRVFSVQHIKGIEFQAVLMVRLDRLPADNADLVDKYLYLGLTRAVEFLGVTVRERLPSSLDCIRPLMVEGDWKDLASQS